MVIDLWLRYTVPHGDECGGMLIQSHGFTESVEALPNKIRILF